MKITHLVALAALASLSLFVPARATAGLLGSTVLLELYDPNLATLAASFGSATVDGTVEHPTIFINQWTSDVDNTTIVLSNLATPNSIGGGSFRGFVYTFTGATTISNVSIDALSSLTPTSFFFTGNTIGLNYAGKVIPNPAYTLVNVEFLPEPSTIGLLIVGACGVGLLTRRKWRSATN